MREYTAMTRATINGKVGTKAVIVKAYSASNARARQTRLGYQQVVWVLPEVTKDDGSGVCPPPIGEACPANTCGAPTSPMVDADQFHPMRGHVASGVRVRFPDGSELTVAPRMLGWTLEDASGHAVFAPIADAIQFTHNVLALASERLAERGSDAPGVPRGEM